MNHIGKLRTVIECLPRVRLAHLPTPLQEATRLSKALRRARIFFKRDDLTGLPLSGNGTRMLEFSFGKALSQGAEIVVQSVAVQSDYCRQFAIACSKLGLEAHLILQNNCRFENSEIQGNLLLDLLADARVKIKRRRLRIENYDKTVMHRTSRCVRLSN